MTYIESPIKDLQKKQVQNWPGTPRSGVNNAIEQELTSPNAPADQKVKREGQFPSGEVSESCDSEIKKPEKSGQIKETGNQSFVASLFNKNDVTRTHLAKGSH